LKQVIAAYPKSKFNGSNYVRVSSMITHDFFACPSRRAAMAITKMGSPVYLYQFTYPAHWIDNKYLGE